MRTVIGLEVVVVVVVDIRTRGMGFARKKVEEGQILIVENPRCGHASYRIDP